MEPSLRSLSAFIGGASETLPSSKKKRSIEGVDVHKTMNGTETRGLNESQPSTWDSLHAHAGSERTKEYTSASSLRDREDGSPVCFCGSLAAGPAGKGKTVGEIIDYGLKHLNEANNALTNLGENLESDLRLMFMDIMGRVQHWVGVGQNRINAAKADLESLEKQSVASSAKDLQLEELRRQLKEAEEKLAAQERSQIPGRSSVGRASQAGEERTSVAVQTADSTENGVDKLQSKSATGNVANTGGQLKDDVREETVDREAELEAELAQVLEENERMMKEREEYENAIHCALLRGVSSLNVAAFKVLHYPQIPCCSPCRPPSTPRSASPETIVTCRPISRCDAAPRPARRGSKTRESNGAANANRCLLQPLSENLLYCGGENERSQENDMLFLLHHGDAGSPCEPCAQPRHRPSVSGSLPNKSSVCTGGKCRKTPSAKEKVPRSPRSPASCFRTRDGRPTNLSVRRYVTIMCYHYHSCADICENVTVNKKNSNTTAKRCVTCNKNRTRNGDD